MLEKNKVSIIIPCYNGERLLHNSLDSILAQTHRNIQVLFVNDGSTDNSEALARTYETAFADTGMEFLLCSKENGGAASAINVGLKHYDGDYVMWLDSDDILLPQSIEQMLLFFKNNPQHDYCIGEGIEVQENEYDKVLRKLARIPVENETKEIAMHDLLCGINSVYGPGTVMCKKELMKTAIPPEGIYESREGQNWQIMIPVTYYGTRGYIRETLFKCVAHADSHSRTKRNCSAKVERERDFLKLCQKSIQSISQMPEEEKKQWNLLIEKHHSKKIFDILIMSLQLKEARRVASQLGQLGCMEIRYRSVLVGIAVLWPKKIVRKIKKWFKVKAV